MNDEAVASSAVPRRTARPARARSLVCPNCGSPVTIRASGITVTAACQSCGSVLDVTNEQVRLIAGAQQRTRNPRLAIGSRGMLAATEWEVVGYQERSSEEGRWRWDEYLLFNPYRGFRFLGEDHGQWTLYAMLRQDVSDDGAVAGDGRSYRLETTVTAVTEYVLGEFYWRVKVGDTAEIREFTSEPYLLAQERSGTEIIWSRGVSLDADTVKEGFGLAAPRMSPEAEVQAAPADLSLRPIWTVAAVAIVLLIVIQAANFGRDRNLLVFHGNFSATPADQGRAMASAAFDVPDGSGNVTLDVAVPVHGEWLMADVALVAVAGDRRFDSGSTIQTAFDPFVQSVTFASVPGGAYKLLVTVSSSTFDKLPAAQPGSPITGLSGLPAPPAPPPPKPIGISVEVRRHTPTMSYFWIYLVVILAWPVLLSIRRWWHRIHNQ